MSKLLDGGRRNVLSVLILVALLAVVGESALVSACPMCRESVNQAGMDESSVAPTPTNPLGAGFAWSIYLMLAVPYLMIATGAFVVWRGIRRAQHPVPVKVSAQETSPKQSPAPLTES